MTSYSVVAVVEDDERKLFSQARLSRDPRFDGRFFIGVKTTGIFCRPVCPARLPAESNVEYYRLAVQALEAGYRPCLRCRPDSAPDSFAWHGVKTTVVRAQKLLSEIPPQPVGRIAERLGVGERYLRQLLKHHTGISPKEYQQFRQVMFAKKLLQQTQLRVEDIAQAAGYNSSRQLQRNLKLLCQLTPSQLRNNCAKSVTGKPALHTALTLFMPYRPPYDWKQVQAFLAMRQVEGVEYIDDTQYRRQFVSHHGVGQVCAVHNPQRHGFDVTLKLSEPRDVHDALGRLAKVLDCYADPQLIAQAMTEAGLPDCEYPAGIRLPGVWSEFESGCRAILGQQVTVTAAIKKLNELVAYFDHRTPWGRAFPSPSEIAEDTLSFIAMPERRKQALRQFAQLYVNDNAPTYDAMLAISGIGPWTIDYIRLRGEHDPDVWLVTDLIVKRQLERFQINASKAAPWRSYLTVSLWHSYSKSPGRKGQ